MTAETQHFKVANGDMSLLQTNSGRSILIDINIRAAAGEYQQLLMLIVKPRA